MNTEFKLTEKLESGVWGSILLRAMGKAIVTTRVGQNLEYLEHGQSGILAAPGDAGAFAQALLQLLADPALARRLGQNAAQRIRDQFTWSHHIHTIEQAYHLAL